MADCTYVLHEFACKCAEDALKLIDNPDKRSINAIKAKRKWLKGEISNEELDAAAKAAYTAADASKAADVAYTAVYAADVAAVYAAVYAAAYTADCAAAYTADVADIVAYIEITKEKRNRRLTAMISTLFK